MNHGSLAKPLFLSLAVTLSGIASASGPSGSTQDLEARYALSRDIWKSISEIHDAVARLRDVREQANALAARLDAIGKGDGVGSAATELAEKLTAIDRDRYARWRQRQKE